LKQRKRLDADKESLLVAADNSGENGHRLTLTAKSNAMRRQLKRRMLN